MEVARVHAGMTTFSDDISSKIIMQGIHVELTEALQNAIREKFSAILRHHGRIIRINVRLHHDQQRGQTHFYNATGQVEISGPDIVASAKGDDAYNAIDELVEKLDQQLRDRHERRKEKRNHPQQVEINATLPKVEPK